MGPEIQSRGGIVPFAAVVELPRVSGGRRYRSRYRTGTFRKVGSSELGITHLWMMTCLKIRGSVTATIRRAASTCIYD